MLSIVHVFTMYFIKLKPKLKKLHPKHAGLEPSLLRYTMKTKQNTYKISVLVILIRYNEYFLSKATTQKIRLFNDDHVESRKPKPISFLRNGPSNNDLEDNFSSTTAHV